MAKTPFFESFKYLITLMIIVLMAFGYQTPTYGLDIQAVKDISVKGSMSISETKELQATKSLTIKVSGEYYTKIHFFIIDGDGRPVPVFPEPVSVKGQIRVLSTANSVEYRPEKMVQKGQIAIRINIPGEYIGKFLYAHATISCGKTRVEIPDWFLVVPPKKPTEFHVVTTTATVSVPVPQAPTIIYAGNENKFTITAGSRGHKPADYENTQQNANWSANVAVGYDFGGVTAYMQDIYGRAPDLPNFNPITTQKEANTIRLGAGLWDNSVKMWGGPITTTNASGSFSLGAELKKEFDYVGPTEIVFNTDLWNKASLSGSVTPLRWEWDNDTKWVGLRLATYGTLVSPSLFFVQSGAGLGTQLVEGPFTLDAYIDYALGGTKYADGKEVGGALYSGLQVTFRPVKKGGQQ